jgi:hypothetical protein
MTEYSPAYYQKYKESIKRASKKWVNKNRKWVNAYRIEWAKKQRKLNKGKIKAINSKNLFVSEGATRNGIALKAGIYQLVKE